MTMLGGPGETAAAGGPMFGKIGVTNFGTKPGENIALRIFVDRKRLPRVVLFEKLEPGIEKVKETFVFFKEAGPHRLRVELPIDSLPADNSRFLAV